VAVFFHFKNDHMELDRLNQVIVQMFRRSIGEELLVGCEVIWQPGAGEIVIVCSSKQQARNSLNTLSSSYGQFKGTPEKLG
jgi:hypothetical protein